MKFSLSTAVSGVSSGPILLRGPVHELFPLVAELGYDGLELHLLHPNQVNRDEVRKLMSQFSLAVTTIGTGMAAGIEGLTFADPDPEVRRRAVMRVKEQIELASFLGSAVTIGLLMGRLGNESADRPNRYDAAIGCLDECCKAAAERAVTVFLEPLNRYESDYVNTVDGVLKMIRHIGLPNVKLLADTFHMNIEEVNLAASLKRVGPSLGFVHLADSNRQAPGHGHLDIREVLGALRDIGYQGYLSFEILPLPAPRQAAEDAIRFVKGILSDL